MKIIEYFASDRKDYWRSKIARSDWGAASFLAGLLESGEYKKLTGETSRVLMLTEGDELISFCSFAELDDIQPTDLTPWIGWVYTFPQHRGHRFAGKLLAHAEALAKAEGHGSVYISTNHDGLYEKYGYEFFRMMKDIDGEDSKVYITRL